MFKNPAFVNGLYYHIYNRGVEKRNIFANRWDYLRFLETLSFYRKTPLPMKLSDFRRNPIRRREIKGQKEIVKILCYCLMPNHFHLLIQQIEENGITIFLKKITDSYTRFYNTKHNRIGPLFQGSFRAKLIETDEYLLQLSKYIHRNPASLSQWRNNISLYPYSSYNYYFSPEEHLFCRKDFILSYFSNKNNNLNYKTFVEENDIEDPKIYKQLIDYEE
ncbi:hypothetical protein C4559_04860 [Candidatus Microgenomates bacterium]|nr:MAG: hypothetical protein C4559_04860 [Candidatus Microgenomates bacterium]